MGLSVTTPFSTRWRCSPTGVDCCGAHRCVCACVGAVKNGITQLPSLQYRNSVLPISNHAPVLCLQLSSTPRLFTVRDQAPGSTSLLSFVSDAAVFPSPLLLKDYGFDPFCPSAEGLTTQRPEPRNACWTLLLLVPRDCGQVPAHPRRSSRDYVAAAFQGL